MGCFHSLHRKTPPDHQLAQARPCLRISPLHPALDAYPVPFLSLCEFVTDRVASLSPPRESLEAVVARADIDILGADSSPPVQIAAAPGRRRHICTMRRRRRSMRTSSRSPRSALHPCASELSSETPLATARRVISSIGSFHMEDFLTT